MASIPEGEVRLAAFPGNWQRDGGLQVRVKWCWARSSPAGSTRVWASRWCRARARSGAAGAGSAQSGGPCEHRDPGCRRNGGDHRTGRCSSTHRGLHRTTIDLDVPRRGGGRVLAGKPSSRTALPPGKYGILGPIKTDVEANQAFADVLAAIVYIFAAPRRHHDRVLSA